MEEAAQLLHGLVEPIHRVEDVIYLGRGHGAERLGEHPVHRREIVPDQSAGDAQGVSYAAQRQSVQTVGEGQLTCGLEDLPSSFLRGPAPNFIRLNP